MKYRINEKINIWILENEAPVRLLLASGHPKKTPHLMW